MVFGFDQGISSFLQRRHSVFQDASIHGSFRERMDFLKNKMHSGSSNKPTVVILGAGPAGLMRAIQSISNGNPTYVIEKRSESAQGRMNTVALTEVTIAMLKYCGIYQYLIEHRMIYPLNPGKYISVSLADLEQAMKAVLKELSPRPCIQYDTQVEKVEAIGQKIGIITRSTEGNKEQMQGIDILVNAEGSHSSTNELLDINRSSVLPKIPVIAAIYKDDRPKIRGPVSLIQYGAKSVKYVAQTIYHHAIFIFRYIFSSWFRKQFTGALLLKTPGQNYLGCGFSDEINQRLLSLKENNKEEYHSFASKWIHYSLCAANIVSLLSPLLKGKRHFVAGRHLSLERFDLIQIGADKASQSYKRIGEGTVLLAGDACATVDPTTGLGCNTAIQSSTDFLDFIWDADAGVPLQRRISSYEQATKDRIEYIHDASKKLRALYRPDAVEV